MYLNSKTFFSYRYGTLSTEDLVKLAAEAGASAMAITNINNTADAWDFMAYCKQEGIKPILGAEIRNGDELLYILLAKNNHGFQKINHFLSHYLQEEKPFPPDHIFDEAIWVIYPLAKKKFEDLGPNELIGILPGEVNKLFSTNVSAYPNKFVMRQPVTFADRKGYNLHRLLRAIDKNIVLSRQCDTDIADDKEMMMPPATLLSHFSKYPNIVTNTLQVIDSCEIDLEFHTDKNKKCFSATLEDDRILLQKLAKDGLEQRFGRSGAKQYALAQSRVDKELKIINELGFNAYFLITWDIIRYAQSRGFYYVGRGSGANSIVAYCLCITDVNPIELDLYFERFLNPYRTSPPDFDIDFSWKDRDEVIDYVFKRYGKDYVALLGMYSTFQYNAIVRELGKVFGLPKSEIDTLANGSPQIPPADKIHATIMKYGAMMQNFPNHHSIHPGGMLISEKPIYEYCAVNMPPKGFATAQVDMFVAEKVGLYKLDILSQRGLGHIKEAIRLVKQNRQVSVDIHEIEKFKKDKKVAERIRRADTIGCFYIESPGMRQLLKKLECDDYITLVAASSIIRPGVSKSGMMREYIYRYHNPGKFEYLHPKMKELLEETYGVMVYQEDVIKVAHHFAGLDMGEADILRRAMSGKYRGNKEMVRIQEKFFTNCRELGHPEAISKEVWRQIESFGGYSFSKAHSASFAVESYQSLYLKTYYPMEFMVAVINNFGGFYNTELYFHELRRAGARILPPCVNHGEQLTNIRDKEVYVGFIHIQNLEENSIHLLLKERQAHGSFLHLQDFIERTNLGIEQVNLLIRVGAFRFSGKNKKQLLWEANFLQKRNKQPAHAGTAMFTEPPLEFHLPTLTQHPLEDAEDELELLGFALCNAFDLVDAELSGLIPAAQLPVNLGKEIRAIGYYVTTKPVRTVRGQMMQFGTFLDQHGDWLDTVHFPDSAAQYPLSGKGFYLLTGLVVEEFGVYSIEVRSLKKAGLKIRKET